MIQAEGLNNLENGENHGDDSDLFHSNTKFGDITNPASKWRGGSSSGLEIFNINFINDKVVFSAR